MCLLPTLCRFSQKGTTLANGTEDSCECGNPWRRQTHTMFLKSIPTCCDDAEGAVSTASKAASFSASMHPHAAFSSPALALHNCPSTTVCQCPLQSRWRVYRKAPAGTMLVLGIPVNTAMSIQQAKRLSSVLCDFNNAGTHVLR